jgi:hypothetical protein
LGHLTFASFETPAHPKENTAKIANSIMMLTHFLIPIHLLSPYSKKIAAQNTVLETDTRNPFLCQEKNKDFFIVPFDVPPSTSFSSVWFSSSPSSL